MSESARKQIRTSDGHNYYEWSYWDNEYKHGKGYGHCYKLDSLAWKESKLALKK